MILERILRIAPPGTVIPRPRARADFRVKGLGRRRGEEALIYTIPNHNKPRKPYQKGVTVSEFERAYEELVKSGKFSRRWFEEHLPECDAEGGCNFTTIGGLFVLMGEAIYIEPGVYQYAQRASQVADL